MTQPNEQRIEEIKIARLKMVHDLNQLQWFSRNDIGALLEENKRTQETLNAAYGTIKTLTSEKSSLSDQLQQTREELDIERESRQSDIDEIQLQNLAEIGRLSKELEQVKAELQEAKDMLIHNQQQYDQVYDNREQVKAERDKLVREVEHLVRRNDMNRESYFSAESEVLSLHTELAAKDKALQEVMIQCKDAGAYTVAANSYHTAYKVTQSYPPREKGADNEQRD